LQAANSADFSIAQFRFLEDLLLKHGRFNLRRMSKLICYMFYKNILLTTVQFYFTIQTGFSGQKVYSEYGIQVYNVYVTAFPIILLGIFDRDVTNKYSKQFPQLYIQGVRGEFFNPSIFWGWVLTSIVESVFIIIFAFYTLEQAGENGEDGDLWQIGTVAYFLVILIANFKVSLQQYLWFWFSPIFLFGGILMWIATGSLVSSVFIFEPSYYGVFLLTLSLPAFWLAVLLAPVMTLGRDVVWKFLKRNMFPEVYHIVSEINKISNHQVQVEKEKKLKEYLSGESEEPYGFGEIIPDDQNAQSRALKRTNSGFAYSMDQAATSVESRVVSSGHSFHLVTQAQV